MVSLVSKALRLINSNGQSCAEMTIKSLISNCLFKIRNISTICLLCLLQKERIGFMKLIRNNSCKITKKQFINYWKRVKEWLKNWLRGSLRLKLMVRGISGLWSLLNSVREEVSSCMITLRNWTAIISVGVWVAWFRSIWRVVWLIKARNLISDNGFWSLIGTLWQYGSMISITVESVQSNSILKTWRTDLYIWLTMLWINTVLHLIEIKAFWTILRTRSFLIRKEGMGLIMIEWFQGWRKSW